MLRRRSRAVGEGSYRVPGGRIGLAYVAGAGLLTTVLSIVLSTLPTGVAESPGWFVARVFGGAAGLMGVGLLFYWRSVRRDRRGRGAATV